MCTCICICVCAVTRLTVYLGPDMYMYMYTYMCILISICTPPRWMAATGRVIVRLSNPHRGARLPRVRPAAGRMETPVEFLHLLPARRPSHLPHSTLAPSCDRQREGIGIGWGRVWGWQLQTSTSAQIRLGFVVIGVHNYAFFFD